MALTPGAVGNIERHDCHNCRGVGCLLTFGFPHEHVQHWLCVGDLADANRLLMLRHRPWVVIGHAGDQEAPDITSAVR